MDFLQAETPVILEAKGSDFARLDGAASEALDRVEIKLTYYFGVSGTDIGLRFLLFQSDGWGKLTASIFNKTFAVGDPEKSLRF